LYAQDVPRLLTAQLLARAHQRAHLLGRAVRHEARADKAMGQKIRHPVGIFDVALAAGYAFDMCSIGQHQLELAIGQDVPHRLPVDAGRFHGDMRAFVLGQPLRQRNQVRGRRGERANLLRRLAVDHEAHAGNHRVLVNVETTAAGMQDFHRLLLTRRRRGIPANELYRTCSGPMTTRDDRLRCSRIPGPTALRA